MKKVLFAALLLIGTQGAFAQINKGQWLVGGNVGFNSAKQGEMKATSFNFSPNAGHFFINNFAGGLRVNIESEKFEGADDAETILMVAPFLRYYFLPAAQKVNIFADAHYGFGSFNEGESASLNEFQFAAGPAIFLSPNTALEFALYYNSKGGEAYENVDGDRLSNFGLQIGFQVHLGKGKSK